MVLQLGLGLQASAHEPSSVISVLYRKWQSLLCWGLKSVFVWIEKDCMHLFTRGCEIRLRTKAAGPTAELLTDVWVFAKTKAPCTLCHHFFQYRAKGIYLNKDEMKSKVFNFTNWLSTGVGCLGTLLKPWHEVSQNRLNQCRGVGKGSPAEIACAWGMPHWWSISKANGACSSPGMTCAEA